MESNFAEKQPQASQESSERSLVSVEMSLSGAHLNTFEKAISNILSTPIAEETYAQIIDGLPLTHVAQDSANEELPPDHPIHDEHAELCSGVLEKAQEFKAKFTPGSLKLDTTLINDYRASAPGSRAFKMRLIELVAEAVHEIAVLLFNSGTSLHSDQKITSWTPPKDDIFWEMNPEGHWPTLFYHQWYSDHEQYPSGIADMVGFWAEARILGGVVLFDRRDPNKFAEAQPDSIWFHSDRSEVTYRIYQLLDGQKLALLDFLTSEAPRQNVLPILGDEKNICREDPEQPIEETGIYRHIWDRKPPSEDACDGRSRDVWDEFDYPTLTDFRRAQARARELRQRPYMNQ